MMAKGNLMLDYCLNKMFIKTDFAAVALKATILTKRSPRVYHVESPTNIIDL